MSRRPTAFEVSFPGELQADPASAPASYSDSDAKAKRKGGVQLDARAIKRPKSKTVKPTRVHYYVPERGEILESKILFAGEDTEEDRGNDDENNKPIRYLSSFAFFDPSHEMELVSLGAMEEVGKIDRQFEGAGVVQKCFANEEDEGQEDDLDEESQPCYCRLGAILRYFIDYGKLHDPVWVETQYAWYMLQAPSRAYRPYFLEFYKPLRVTQLVIASGLSEPDQDYETFLNDFLEVEDDLLGSFDEDDLKDAIPDIKVGLDEHQNRDELCRSPFLRQLLRNGPPSAARVRDTQRPRLNGRYPQNKTLIGNLDLAVLRAENQNPTHVTPFIASLSSGLVQERFKVIGPPETRPNPDIIKQQQDEAFIRLRSLVLKSSRPRKNIISRVEQRLKPRSGWYRSIEVDDVTYSIGEVVVVPIGEEPNKKTPRFPKPDEVVVTDTIPKYFWFAKIIYINGADEMAHVQWFQHSSLTGNLGDIHDPQELFLVDQCDPVALSLFAGKVTVHHFVPTTPKDKPNFPPSEYYYKFVHNKVLGDYTDIDIPRIRTAESMDPPDNCPVCLLVAQKAEESHDQKLPRGVALQGKTFHPSDFVLIRAENGPCKIGYIISLKYPSRARRQATTIVTVRLLGRVSSISVLPASVLRDERHLYITDEELNVQVDMLISVIYVVPRSSIPDFDSWMSLFPTHFYFQYRFPSLEVKSWSDKRPLRDKDLYVCSDCMPEELEREKLMKEFLRAMAHKPLRTLDLFGGVGAFGLGMEEFGCIRVTHAVEISPSAAKTFRENSPNTAVFNQCANIVLRFMIKTNEGHRVDIPVSIGDGTPVPASIKPGEIDCIIVGFPCQPHSRLNMFQRADDIKSNLIWNVLAWIDYFRPKFAFFENVRGFLQFRLNAVQAGPHKVKGGIELGGLKLVTRAMLAMNYQVRSALLQAAHYGAPQSRVRFFLMAALTGHHLPELPQPTHDFPLVDALEIKLPNGDNVRSIRTANGTAPNPFVTIESAIGDLPRFDWKNPGLRRETAAKRQEAREREKTIPTFACKQESPRCGYNGVVPYYHEPRTSYQVRSRRKQTRDLQQYTRSLISAKVERVVNIPLVPKADYRCLRPDLLEWQLANPASAVAKGGFRPGFYGRLDKDGWFSTTVTNMDPTAKQSKVLHPYCKRMVTVRELARSQGFPDDFVFKSINNDLDVVTMHRQIGNAVPWPVGMALGRELRDALFKKWLETIHVE